MTRTHHSTQRVTPYQELVARAKAAVRTYTPEEAIPLLDEDGVPFVDVREASELAEGMILGATHATRGRLEAHLDPESPHYRDEFDGATEFVYYCASGARSALAAQQVQELGLERVANLDGGFAAWTEAGGPTQSVAEPECA